jgi:hypothetical protein
MSFDFNIDYQRLADLGVLIKDGKATKAEKDEYMYLLYKSGQLPEKQYNEYKNGDKYADDIVNAALAIGAIFLMGWLVSKLFEK